MDKSKTVNFITNRKYMITTISVLAGIGIVFTGILIFLNASELVAVDGASQISNIQYNIIRLEIFKLCFVLLLTATAGAICIMLVLKTKLEYIYLVAVLCLGISYMFAITPFSIPDGHHHYQSSYIISGYMLFNDDPYMIDTRHLDYRYSVGHSNIPEAYLRLMNEGVYIIRGDAELTGMIAPYSTQYPMWNIPQALGISIARLIGLSFFGVFYLGRIFNFLFYSVCTFFAIKRLNAFKLPMFLISLTPMILQQAASNSSDTFVNAVAFLFTAYAVSCIYEKDMFRWRDFCVLMILGVLLGPAKVVYLPIIFLIFVVAWRWKETIKGKAWILAALTVAASVAFAMLFFGASTTDLAGSQENWEGEQNYTLAFILANPFETLLMYLRTIYYFAPFYVLSLFGRYLSGLTIILPYWYVIVTIFLILAGVLYGKRDEWQPSVKERIIFALICAAVVFLNLTVLMLGWTSDTHEAILGVAGRYFIPILPLALLILRFKKFFISNDSFQSVVIFIFFLMQSTVVMYILNDTIEKYG